MFKVMIVLVLSALVSACALEAEISVIMPPPIEGIGWQGLDFYYGEVVTTPSESVVIGVFGEIAKKQVLSNGAVVEGAFYE